MADFNLQEGQMFIFTNGFRDPASKQPTHQGSTKIDGKEYDISCWVKEGKNGKFFSCQVKTKWVRPIEEEVVDKKDYDDDIPF